MTRSSRVSTGWRVRWRRAPSSRRSRSRPAQITALLGAVKSYTQVDRASMQLVNVTEGIESTLVILGHKLGEQIEVVRDYTPNLPRRGEPRRAQPGVDDLIDNTVDTMDGAGTLRITTKADGHDLVVEIVDSGPGMPEEVESPRSSHSSRPRRSARAPGSASTSRAGSSSTTTARSRSTRSRAEPRWRCDSHSPTESRYTTGPGGTSGAVCGRRR